MKLAAAAEYDITTIKFAINESDEAPQWGFKYNNWKTDPNPSILVLGAYTHPNTGNNLVGGINLNYLDAQQKDELARTLPKLMQITNLRDRYHLGKQLLPGIFDSYYRTYDAKHIRGVNQSIFHPKYGMMKTTKDFIAKKLGGLLKTKAQRAQALQPQFPNDLSGMYDTVSQTANQLGNQATSNTVTTPEIKTALDNLRQFRASRVKDIDDQEDEQFLQASQNFQQPAPATPQQPAPAAPQQPTPQQMASAIEQERQDHQQELLDPNNSIDLNGDGIPESIAYYCPISKRYLIESLDDAILSHLESTLCEAASY